jgi:transcriptional regulator with XRE-family HTH domain
VAARRQRLAERRKALGYSQEFLAEQLGIDRTTVGRWERGETAPYPHVRPELCRVLKVTADELNALLAPDPDGSWFILASALRWPLPALMSLGPTRRVNMMICTAVNCSAS